MDSKDEYITRLANNVSKLSSKTKQEVEQHIRRFLDAENMLLCRDTTQDAVVPEPEVRNRSIPTLDMYYVEFNGHVYLADKKNRVYICNKENPVEIGYIRETENERELVRYEGCQEL